MVFSMILLRMDISCGANS